MRSVLCILAIIFYIPMTWAQADIDALLDRSESVEMDLGRYENRSPSSAKPAAVELEKKETKKIANPTKKSDEAVFDIIVPQRKPAQQEAALKPEVSEQQNATTPPTATQQPSITEQIQELYEPNDNHSKIAQYVEELHPDDNRLNRLELTLHAGTLGNSSKSNYSFREYNLSAPSFGFGAEFWATPLFGIYGDYDSTTGGSVPVANGNISAKYEKSEFGIDFRSYANKSRRANSTILKIFWRDYRVAVSGDSLERTEIKTSGIGIGLGTRLPHTAYYSSLFGAHYLPRSQQREGGTALSLMSGNAPETSEFGVHLGGEIKMNRKNLILWKLQAQYEKSQYDGLASHADPATGLTPSGVTVNNTFYFFSIGYQWAE